MSSLSSLCGVALLAAHIIYNRESRVNRAFSAYAQLATRYSYTQNPPRTYYNTQKQIVVFGFAQNIPKLFRLRNCTSRYL